MRRIHFERTDSTNTRARELWLGAGADGRDAPVLAPAFEGAKFYEPLLVTAEEQTSGRGRHGRTWHSPRGGAWMSLAWPMRREASWYVGASLAAAAAVRRGILEAVHCSSEVQIKWPNDLLIHDRKVAGILCEQFSLPVKNFTRDNRRESIPTGVLIVGVGVNVDFDIALLGPPADLRHPPITLAAAAGIAPSVEGVINSIGERLNEALNAFDKYGLNAALLAEVREHLAYVGEEKSWASPRGVVKGRILDLDDRGRLLHETEHGVKACDVGELQHLAPGR
jgi:BirA family biotin operon repressor/biotin-[acetyl-CoA-carboxylase] ligase